MSASKYLYRIDGIHSCVFLRKDIGELMRRCKLSCSKLVRTAMPANAPAAMFCSREKLGGRDS